jgi:hypothetical protein
MNVLRTFTYNIIICNQLCSGYFQPDNAIPSPDQPPPISSQIELQTVDLLTLTRVGHPLVGHRGFTPSEKAFYLYADVSENFVGSGSEDGKGCLWDRHYGSLVLFEHEDDSKSLFIIVILFVFCRINIGKRYN